MGALTPPRLPRNRPVPWQACCPGRRTDSPPPDPPPDEPPWPAHQRQLGLLPQFGEGRRGQRAAQAAVRQAHFQGQGPGLCLIEVEHTGDGIASHQAQHMVQQHCQHRNDHHRQTVLGEAGLVGAHAHAQHQQDTHSRDQNQYLLDLLQFFAHHCMDAQAQQDRQQDHHHDGEEHVPEVHLDPLTGQSQRQRGRQHGGQQRGAHGDGDGQRHIAVRQEGHHVRGRSAGDAAQQHQAHRDLCAGLRAAHTGEAQELGHQPAEAGHAHILAADAHQHVPGTTEDQGKVLGPERHAHAEHDNAQQQIHKAQGGKIPSHEGDPAQIQIHAARQIRPKGRHHQRK